MILVLKFVIERHFYFNLPQYGLVVVVCKYFLFQPFSIRIGRGGLQVFFISTFLNTDWSRWSASIFYFNLSQYGLVVVVYNTEQPDIQTSTLASVLVRKNKSNVTARNIRYRCFSIVNCMLQTVNSSILTNR